MDIGPHEIRIARCGLPPGSRRRATADPAAVLLSQVASGARRWKPKDHPQPPDDDETIRNPDSETIKSPSRRKRVHPPREETDVDSPFKKEGFPGIPSPLE